MVTHKVKCNVCKHFPITGLRYHCLKCLNFNLCQTCFFTGQLCKPHKKTHPIVEHCRTVSARDNIKLFSRVIRNNLLPGRCKRKEALRRKALGLMDNRDFPTQGQPHPSSIQLVSTEDLEPPDLFTAEHTSNVQLNHPSDAKASQAHQKDNHGRSLDQKITSSQILSSLELELAKTQESIKALQNENRHLRKQLAKWKNQVQALHSAQEDRNHWFDELIVNQENLKMELQKMRIEIKTLYNNKSLKERNIQHGTSHPPFKPKHMKYLKCKSAPCIEKKWFLKEPPLTKNPRMPATTLQSQPSPHASSEVVQHENLNRETVPLTNHSGGQKPEHSEDHFSMEIKASSSHFSPPVRQTEEEELQHLLTKLKNALSFQAQPGQSCLPKDGLLSTAEHVYKSFSDVISQVTLPTMKYEGSGTSPFLLLHCPR
uniref:ZZ-type domain-containing protein n=2 Tax=Anolis carolinensis TaxID=28377 RepID=R4GCX3_ANOCA